MGRNIPSPGSRWVCLTCLSWFIKTWKHIERIVKILPPCMCLFVQNNLMFSFLLCVCTYCTWLLLVINGYNPLQWMAPRYHFMFEAGTGLPRRTSRVEAPLGPWHVGWWTKYQAVNLVTIQYLIGLDMFWPCLWTCISLSYFVHQTCLFSVR